MTRKMILLGWFVALLTTSCAFNTSTVQGDNREITDQCIPPDVKLAFPAREERSSGQPLFVPLPQEWKLQSSPPEKVDATLELIEHQPGYDVIWLNSGDGFLLYRTDTKEWSNIPFAWNGNEIRPESLFQDQSGQVWGVQRTLRDSSPLLFQRNASGGFEFVADAENKLTNAWTSSQTPIIDKKGAFWFMLLDDKQDKMALFSFDPRTRAAGSHLIGGEYEFGRSIAMSPDGSIFLVRPEEKEVVRYFPDTETYDIIDLSVEIEGDLSEYLYPDLFSDQSGKLWIGDYGWLEMAAGQSPQWYQIVRSPIFITKNSDPGFTFMWIRPRPMLESSDGRIWFRAFPSGGLTWLDPEKELWCKFTTIDTEIMKDHDGDLWLFYENELYKYSVKH